MAYAKNCKELPKFHFPFIHCPHGNKRELFVDYGIIRSLGVVENKDAPDYADIICEKQFDKFGADELLSSEPSMPLFEPNKVTNPFEEPCYGELAARKIEVKACLTRLTHMKGHLQQNKKKRTVCHELHELNQDIINREKNICHPDSSDEADSRLEEIRKKVRQLKLEEALEVSRDKLGNDIYVPDVNANYSGGCLSYQPSIPGSKDDSGAMFYIGGDRLNQLKCMPVDVSTGSLQTQADPSTSLPLDSMIREVDSSTVHGRTFCAVREDKRCSLIDVSVTESGTLGLTTTCVHSWEAKEKPVSVSLSPFIAGEWVAATCVSRSANVHLISSNGRLQTLLTGLDSRFECDENAWQCHWGSNPRIVALTDRSGVALYDVRRSSVQGLELFSLPHGSLHRDERVMSSKQHPRQQCYHLVATDFSLLLVDERFANHPVLHWSHPLLSLPMYLDVVPSAGVEADLDIALLASQLRAEVLAVPLSLNAGSSLPPQGAGNMWKISQIDDFALLASRCGIGVDQWLVEHSLRAPLVGVCGIPHPRGGFTAVQMTSFGDLFYQDYRPRDPKDLHWRDKTHCVGPGSGGIELKDETREVASRWLKEAYQHLLSSWKRTAKSSKPYDASDSFVAIHNKTYPHVLCQMCMPSGVGGDRGPADPSSGAEDLCLACDNPITYSRGVRHAAQTHTVMPLHNDDVVAMPRSLVSWDPESVQDPNSRIIRSLWNEDAEAIPDLVGERDVETEAQREVLIAEYKTQQRSGLEGEAGDHARAATGEGGETVTVVNAETATGEAGETATGEGGETATGGYVESARDSGSETLGHNTLPDDQDESVPHAQDRRSKGATFLEPRPVSPSVSVGDVTHPSSQRQRHASTSSVDSVGSRVSVGSFSSHAGFVTTPRTRPLGSPSPGPSFTPRMALFSPRKSPSGADQPPRKRHKSGATKRQYTMGF